MKNVIWILIIPFFLASCGESEAERKLRLENDSLKAVVSKDGQALNNFITAINDIQANLDKIKEQESIITINATQSGELDQTRKDQINDDILTLYKMMVDNKEKVSSLNKKIKSANYANAELKKMLENLNRQLDERDTQINELKSKLDDMDILVESLNSDIAKLSENVENLADENKANSEIIEKQTTALNTAHYVIGTKKELIDQRIVTKEGGFIGIGGMAKLVEDFNKDYFKKIDVTKVKAIPVFAKEAKLVTTHPAKSYKITGKDRADSLVILNQNEFWSVSKYLVILVSN